jgi:hypothetical protein
MITDAQNRALDQVAKAFGWDKWTIDELRLLMWAAFHYYVRRLP